MPFGVLFTCHLPPIVPASFFAVRIAKQYSVKSKSMDRTGELINIFDLSGLKNILATKGCRYFPKERFSKLKFEGNDFRISSIEFYELVREDSYFRIHYLEKVPAWLPDTLASWPHFRNANATGTNFLGDAMMHAKNLANLLAIRR
jgi:hypothetical protein